MATAFSSLKKTKRAPLPLLGSISNMNTSRSLRSETPATSPSDTDLIGLMSARLAAAEAKLRQQNAELIEKNKRIEVLEEKVRLLSIKAKDNGKSEKFSEIENEYIKLQQQVREMEEFLQDYGMVWVGNSKELTDSEIDEADLDRRLSPDTVWRQNESLVGKQPIDFDRLVAGINELNTLSEEGVSKVEHTRDGARLRTPDPVNFILYANGIVLFSGPFRPFTDPNTQNFVRDVLDGYFPSELQQRYPDGIPFKLTDRRNVYFNDMRGNLFAGEGQTIGGQASSSRLLHHKPDPHERFPQRKDHHYSSEETQLPGPKLTVDQFVNKLPRAVIKNGNVIDIRQSVRQQLQPLPLKPVVKTLSADTESSAKPTTTDVPTNTSTSSSAGLMTNLRIISEDCIYEMSLSVDSTIGHIRRRVSRERKSSAAGEDFDIMSTFPHRIYSDDAATLQQCGLTSNVTLHLRTRKK